MAKKRKVIYGDTVESNWLATHPNEVAQYAGQYIAIVGEKVVAHGYDFIKVHQEAKKYGDDPLFDKVPEVGVLAL